MKKKVGIYGGTFDPIHLGHLITARSVKEIRNLSEIIFVPAHKSPLKLDIESTSAKDRFSMTKLAVEKIDGFSVSDYEVDKTEISYTINTIKYFKKKYKNIELIIGYDNFLVFNEWYKWEEILNLVDIIVLKRFNQDEIEPKVNYEKFIFVENPTIQINSTMIRERVSKEFPIDFLVSSEVSKFITENNLYKK